MLELIHRAKSHAGRPAVISNGRTFSYADLSEASERVACSLLNGKSDLNEARVAFMIKPGFDYVSIQWGIWRAGGIAVPLSLHSPLPALQYQLDDAACEVIIAGQEFTGLLSPAIDTAKHRFISTEAFEAAEGKLPDIATSRRAMIIYTSGTTGKPKGVVTTHANIESQVSTLVSAWHWQPSDHVLNVLPLHHVHGVINVVSCALWAGACCQFIEKFDAGKVLRLLAASEVNVFMAVPTIYYKLIDQWRGLDAQEQQKVSNSLRQFRLMVSGSAALPASVMEAWEQLAGQRLLERYGMTETGMAISNPYSGERRAGHIGQALPGVSVRLVDETGKPVGNSLPGEIQVKGANVFKEYWNKPEATENSFTTDGWFKTGDVAILKDGYYRIMGRQSVDIIKSGGYKISALEIEEVLRTHPHIADCAVVGLPDPQWDEIIAAAIVTTLPTDQEQIIQWLSERIPSYQVPRKILLLDELPRNAMGKVTKPEVKTLLSALTQVNSETTENS